MMATDKSIIGELVQKRTPNSKTYLLADGNYRVTIHGGPVHYEDETGNLRNINTTLQDEGDLDVLDLQPSKDSAVHVKEKAEKAKSEKRQGKFNRDLFDYMAAMVPFDLQLPRVWKRGYSIGKGADKISFKPVGASPAKAHPNPELDNVLEYQDAWNDTDVTLQVTPSGVKETLVLKSSEAPTTFCFKVTGLDTATELVLQPPWLEDAAGVHRDVVRNIIQEDGKTFVELVADVEGLEYPVQIDPTVTVQPGATTGKDVYIASTSPDGNNQSQNLLPLNNDTSGAREILIQFDYGLPQGAIINSAILGLWQTGYDGATMAKYADVYRIIEEWDQNTVTWNNAPDYDPTVYATNLLDLAQGEWKEWDITQLLQEYASGIFNNYGLRIISRYGSATQRSFRSSETAYTQSAPKVTIDYTETPTAPTVTTPNGGETWTGEREIIWTASTDPEVAQNLLQYQIQLSRDTGETWEDIDSLTSQGATSIVYNFSEQPESSTCLVRIRAYNGAAYGDWDQSSGVFSIQHNVAPSKPTNLAPEGGQTVDRVQEIIFSWQHNDSNGDPQSKFDLRCRLQGEAVWNEISVITNLQMWEAPAGFFSHGIIEWEVRTYDQADLYSPWSDQAVFLAGDKPSAPIILAPEATVTGPTPTTQWSSSGQVSFQHQVLQSGSLIWDSGDVFSTNKAQTVGIDLHDGQQYAIQVRIKNADGLWSDWASVVVDVTYTPPAEPIISTSTGLGYIQVNITNPEPTGSQRVVARNEVWRREIGRTWVRLASDAGTSCRDYATASGVSYQYRARAVADTGVATYSQIVAGHVNLTGVWLHDVIDPQGTVYQFTRDGQGKDENWENRTELVQYQGRALPVAERDETERHSMSLKLQLLKNTTDYQTLKSLLDRKGTICYRDGFGRKLFGVIPRHFTSDQIGFGQVASFQIHRIDFSEEV